VIACLLNITLYNQAA